MGSECAGMGGQFYLQWRMLELLASKGRSYSIAELALSLADCRGGEVEESFKRRLRRTMDLLSRIHPICEERAGRELRFSIPDDLKTLTVPLTYPELYSLLVSEELLGIFKNTMFCSNFERFFARLRASLGSRFAELLERGRGSFVQSYTLPQDYADKMDVVLDLTRGILEHRSVVLTYQSLDAAEPDRRLFDPYTLWLRDSFLYCIGLCNKHGAVRVFKVKRILHATLQRKHFVLEHPFDLKGSLRSNFGMIWDTPATYRLIFTPRSGTLAREELAEKDHTATLLPDGRVELEFTLGGSLEIARWVRGWGNEVEVQEPAELAARLRAEAEERVG